MQYIIVDKNKNIGFLIIMEVISQGSKSEADKASYYEPIMVSRGKGVSPAKDPTLISSIVEQFLESSVIFTLYVRSASSLSFITSTSSDGNSSNNDGYLQSISNPISLSNPLLKRGKGIQSLAPRNIPVTWAHLG